MEEQTTPVAEATAVAAPDLAAELVTLKEQLATLTAAKAAADAAAEEARRERLSEQDRVAEDRKALEAERNKLKSERRKDALGKLGVLEKAAALAPDVDPSDPSGAKALEDWAKANPEFVRAAVPSSTPYDAPKGSNLGKILSGEMKSPIISREGLRKLMGGN
jgi:hypothetical protein